MISAFGVDHGSYEEIEKISLGGVGAMAGGAFKKLGQGIGMGARRGAAKSGQMAGRSLAGGNKMLGGAQIRAGQGLKKVSGFAMNRPGLTGGLAAGGAAAGVGGAGAAFGNRRRV
jgi:hypothetical protein